MQFLWRVVDDPKVESESAHTKCARALCVCPAAEKQNSFDNGALHAPALPAHS